MKGVVYALIAVGMIYAALEPERTGEWAGKIVNGFQTMIVHFPPQRKD